MIICIGCTYFEFSGSADTITELKHLFRDYLTENVDLSVMKEIEFESTSLIAGEPLPDGWIDKSENDQKEIYSKIQVEGAVRTLNSVNLGNSSLKTTLIQALQKCTEGSTTR